MRRVCSAHAVLSREPCWVFSLGSNGQTDFEEAIRSRYEHCKIHVYDPTISEEVAAKVAEVTQVLHHEGSLPCPSHWQKPARQTWPVAGAMPTMACRALRLESCCTAVLAAVTVLPGRRDVACVTFFDQHVASCP